MEGRRKRWNRNTSADKKKLKVRKCPIVQDKSDDIISDPCTSSQNLSNPDTSFIEPFPKKLKTEFSDTIENDYSEITIKEEPLERTSNYQLCKYSNVKEENNLNLELPLPDRNEQEASEDNQDKNEQEASNENQDRNEQEATEANQDRNEKGAFQENQDRNEKGASEENQDRNEKGAFQENQDRNEKGAFQENQDRNEKGAFQENQDRNEKGAFQENQDRNEKGAFQENQDRNEKGASEENQDRNEKGDSEENLYNGELPVSSDSQDNLQKEKQGDYLQNSFTYYKTNDMSCSGRKENDLRVFQVLDECVASEDDDNSPDDSASDISYGEIEAMLEEGLDKNPSKDNLATPDANGIRYAQHSTLVLEELGHNHFDMLPEGWIQVIHKCGMPIYLHKGSRVCTFSRPYYLGQGSVRKHNIPLNAIPCLQYRRALEEEEEKKKEMDNDAKTMSGSQYLHTAKIETTEENKLSQSLNPFAIQQYCKNLFRFKKEQRLHFVSWTDRRKYEKVKKNEREQHRPSFPDGTKLIKFPIQNPDDGPKSRPRGEWIMNPNGKSYICILHEYVQHALKKQPTYEFKALENPSTPYSATVIINDMKYGYGTGTSKKHAKLSAAKASLEILIPEMREKIRSDNKNGKRSGITNFPDEEESNLSIFDEIKIEDPRVAEFCAKTTEPSPYSILLTCLQRNFGLKDMPINYNVNPLHRQSNEFIMTVGKHTARVICKNKKEGKQRASQAILQDLHPHITSWGALLRLYGNRSVRNVKEKKQEEQEITMLQSKASLNSPNYSIINKLRSEMNKLYDQQMKVRPIGVFIPPEEVALPSSGTELDKVDF